MARITTKKLGVTPLNSEELIKASQAQPSGLSNVSMPTRKRDWVTFIDVDHTRDGSAQKNYEYITIPTIPLELAYSSENSLQALASFGRNNPFYQYTGSEDTLSFTLDFYSLNNAKDDVMYWCRWLEAMSKPDGYRGGLHRVILQWGRDDRLFADETWFISKANYKLSQFQSHRSLLPAQAFVEITMVRVVDRNRLTADIVGMFRQPSMDKVLTFGPKSPNVGNGLTK